MEVINYNDFVKSNKYRKYSNDVRINMDYLGYSQIMGNYLETKNNKCIEKTKDVVNSIIESRKKMGHISENAIIVFRRFEHMRIPYLEIFIKNKV